MDNKFFTFLILSNDATKARQYKVPVKTLKKVAWAAGIAAVILIAAVIDYSRLKYNTSELYSLRKENTAQKIELQEFAAKLRDMDTKIASLNMLDRKLRIIANIEMPKNSGGRPDQIMGLGGGTSPEDEGVSVAGKNVSELTNKMRSEIKQLESAAKTQETSFTELQSQLMNKSAYMTATPAIWPIRGWVTSTFGERVSPFTGFNQMHQGIDIANKMGTPVLATANGIVVQSNRDEGLGKAITISHGYGVKTIYGHLSEVYVRPGQRVKRGDKIGAVGNTGRSTGPHLHYQVSVNGVNVNPAKYIVD